MAKSIYVTEAGSVIQVPSLSTAISTEVSVRSSEVVSLSTAIGSGGGGSTTGETSLSTGLSSEISSRTSADTSLSTIVSTHSSQIVSLSTAIISGGGGGTGVTSLAQLTDVSLSSLAGQDMLKYNSSSSKWENTTTIDLYTNLANAQIVILTGTTLSGITNLFPSLSTAVSTEVSTRTSSDTSLSTGLSSEISSRTSNVTSLSTGLSSEISSRTSNVTSLSTIVSSNISSTTSLSTGLSTEISNRTSNVTSLSTGLSTEVSTRTSVDTSLSTGLSTEISNRTSNVTSLSTGLSSEISSRTSSDTSLSSSVLQPWIDINRCGFVDNTQTTINFNSGTMTFTLTGTTWSYYRAGLKYTISGNKSVTIPSATNTYYITINNTTGTLESGTTAWTLADSTLPVVSIRYNSTLNPTFLMADERHTILIDRQMHRYEHLTAGTQYISGGVLDGPTLTPPVPTDISNTFGLSSTIIADEDLFHTLPAFVRPSGTTNVFMHFLRSGTTSWYWKLDNMPYLSGATGYIQYDLNGVMTNGIDNRFYNTYILFSNVNSSQYAVIQGRNVFTSSALAQAETPLTFDLSGIPVVESVLAYQLTWGTNNTYNNKGRCRLAVAPKMINISSTSTVGSGAGTDHNTLAGLQGGTTSEFYHLTNTDYLVVTGLSSSISTLTSTDLSLSTTISTEVSTRSSVDTSLSSGLSTEVSTITSNVTSLSTEISTEISNRTSDTSSLSTEISNEISNRSSIETSLSSSILSHSGSTGSSYDDTSISTALSTEISNRTSEVTSLSTEISTRSSEITSLSTEISGEISTRSSEVTSLSTAILSHSGSTGSGSTYDDTSISTALSTEISTRSSEITALSTEITGKTDKYATIVPHSTAFTIQESDNGKILEITEAMTITLPDAITPGFQCVIMNMGTTISVEFLAESFLYCKNNNSIINTQYTGAILYKRDSNSWVLMGATGT